LIFPKHKVWKTVIDVSRVQRRVQRMYKVKQSPEPAREASNQKHKKLDGNKIFGKFLEDEVRQRERNQVLVKVTRTLDSREVWEASNQKHKIKAHRDDEDIY
jgi:hypothetical protein